MDMQDYEMPSLTRGEWKVVHTVLLFLNDGEESVIRFSTEHGKAIVKLKFTPTLLQQPPFVHTTPVREENCLYFNFHGWNSPQAYSAIIPTKFASLGKHELAFSACNTYLGGTNKLELQFYSRYNDE